MSKVVERVQKLHDRFYREHGPCCAGCDWWRWHNSAVGDCTRTAPVSATERKDMLGMEAVSLEPAAGHLMTPRDHVCGEFEDTYDWSNQ